MQILIEKKDDGDIKTTCNIDDKKEIIETVSFAIGVIIKYLKKGTECHAESEEDVRKIVEDNIVPFVIDGFRRDECPGCDGCDKYAECMKKLTGEEESPKE